MSARGKKKQQPVAPEENRTELPAPSNWPADFVPLRSAALVAFCIAAWGLGLGLLASGNSLLGLKQACMVIAGARLEPMLMVESLHSMDIAAVLFAFVLVAGAGYIHVSLGLAVLLAIRPWLDGYVYEIDNLYFLWAAMLLLALWGLRHWATPRPVRGVLPLGLLALYWGISALTGTASIQFDSTARELLFWAYYWTILFLAINATESRVACGVVLAGFFAGMAGQALYAYPYLGYLLPWMRQEMGRDPRQLAAFFDGITEFTPEIARRFNMNRASASMVYPNALAALLVLGLPACLTLALAGWRDLRSAPPEAPAPVTEFRYILPAGLVLFSGIALTIFLIGQLALTYALAGTSPWFGGPGGLALLSVAGAAAASIAFLFSARSLGLIRAGQWLGTIALSLLFPTMLGALWITYSRGALLALAAATVATLLLLRWRNGGNPLRKLLSRSRHGVAAFLLPCLVVLAVLVTLAGPFGMVPPAAAQDAAVDAQAVTGAGIDVTLSDLANPASFRLRLSYWRVALSMAADNWLTGVGMGNFKYAYPAYQYLGAGDVQNAHNGLLQAWCETGVFGLAALVAFWLSVLWAGMRAVIVPEPRFALPLALGLLAGLMAFLLHALLDMNLTHPTLVTFAMTAAGLLLRTASTDVLPGHAVKNTRLLTVLLLALSVVASGLAMRPWLLHIGMNGGKFLGVGSRDMLDRRFHAASFLLADSAGWARHGREEPAPAIAVTDLVSLIADREQLFTLGRLVIQDPVSGSYMRVRQDGAIPPGAVFQVVRPWDAHAIGFERVEAWLAELERLDAHAPYNPELALLISRGYKLLAEQAGIHQEARRDAVRTQMQHWGEEAVRRSPLRADLLQYLGWVYWTSGVLTTGHASLERFESALLAFERATQRAPNEPNYHFARAQALAALGRSYQNAGQAEQAARYSAQAAAAQAAGETIQQRRWQLGLP